jgi:F0F1-type ATP synthase membrane subunit b/b'
MTFLRVPARLRRLLLGVAGMVLLLPVCVPMRAQDAAATPQSAANRKQTVLNETDEYRMSPSAGVGYGLLKLLPKTFRKRSADIQKHLVDARTATEEATSRLSSVEERLAKLDEQIASMRSHAEADSARDEERIKASVEDEKNKIVAAAEAEIQSATTLARREIQKYAAELAIEQAARKLVVSADTDRLLVESFAHKLGEGSSN